MARRDDRLCRKASFAHAYSLDVISWRDTDGRRQLEDLRHLLLRANLGPSSPVPHADLASIAVPGTPGVEIAPPMVLVGR